MAKEIERKYLVKDQSYREKAIECHEITQAYLSRNPDSTVRIRIRDTKAFITVKSRNNGCVRNEWEYPIPVADALSIIENCRLAKVIRKRRYLVPAGNGLTWEVDEFSGEHAGLTVAEIELPDPATPFTLPSFIDREVTGDPAYYNSNL